MVWKLPDLGNGRVQRLRDILDHENVIQRNVHTSSNCATATYYEVVFGT